jgi:fumarylacetoacetase
VTWLGVADDDPFGIDHLPYGSALGSDGRPRVLVRVGAQALDLTLASFGTPFEQLFAPGSLDALLAAGPGTWAAVRAQLVEWLTDVEHRTNIEPLLAPVDGARLVLPFAVADYVDFYASQEHATNVGRMFRPDSEPLPPNWKHLPIGYHGRSGTVVVSGTEIRRPSGQYRAAGGSIVFGASERLDIEAELGFVVGVGTDRGSPVPLAAFREHVFGVCLLNDWSARDIQAWEYVPLGPFLGKSFATSVSAWVTPLAALAAAWTTPPPRDPAPLPHLADDGRADALRIDIEIRINGHLVARPPFAGMYWTAAQMLAHLTSNGASLRAGDLYASGTISGSERDQLGSLLELSWNGTEPIDVGDGRRTFLEDGDEVVITAVAPGPRGPIGLGEVRGRVTP